MKKDLILASKSPYRKELLERLGLSFRCVDPQYDEAPLKKLISNPEKLTQELSIGKAQAVLKLNQNSVIIGSDQVCHIEGEILGKTGSYEKSILQLEKLSGKKHELITSYAIMNNEKTIIKTNITQLFMRKLTTYQIKNYLSADNPIDCAGSYKLELKGISLMEKIITEDYTAIIGLPLISLANELTHFEFPVPPEK